MSPAASRPARFVFDLDGTISDPAEGIGRSIDHALRRHGHPGLDFATVSRWIGPPLDRSFRQLVPEADDQAVASMVDAYRERYATIGHAEGRLYEEIPEAVAALAADAPLALCTTKRIDFAQQILALFGLRGHFGALSGGDIGITKTEQLRALREAGLVAPDAVMIGDRAWCLSSRADDQFWKR